MSIFHAVIKILEYICSLKIVDIPLHIAYAGVIALVGYCMSMIIVSFPCSILEAVTKKKIISEEVQKKTIHIVTICLDIILAVILLHELAMNM